MITVEAGARLHFGFQNLALAHPRLYGGVGVGLDEPRIVLDVEQATTVECADEAVEPYLEAVVEELDVEGARVTVRERFARHTGLGSGTQLALACLAGVARAYGLAVRPRERAPRLGRGGRSGVGVATFERGGFVADIGHPTARFTTDPPRQGAWTVPPVLGRWTLPPEWRFVLVTPVESERGPSSEAEDRKMRAAVEQADPAIADEIAGLLTRELLPAVVADDRAVFGRAVERLGQLNGAWYTGEQGGVYRPPAGNLVAALTDSTGVTGAGQSSWGPTVYGVTSTDDAAQAVAAGERALDAAAIDGRVRVVAPSETGVTLSE